jgi:hypothetical protein
MSDQDAAVVAPLESQRDEGTVVGASPRPAPPRFHPYNWPIRLKLGLLTLSLGLAPAVAAAALLAYQADMLVHDTQARATDSRARAAAALVDGILDADVRLMQGIAASDPALLLVTHPGVAQGQQIQQYRRHAVQLSREHGRQFAGGAGGGSVARTCSCDRSGAKHDAAGDGGGHAYSARIDSSGRGRRRICAR